jgi:hypothetical protein
MLTVEELKDSLEGVLTINPQAAIVNAESYSYFCLGSWYTFNQQVPDPNNPNNQVVCSKLNALSKSK